MVKRSCEQLTQKMAHINKKIDLTVAAFIVYQGKILLVDHKALKKWLPIGGHVELDEDPEQALFREIEEESGLTQNEIKVLGEKPDVKSPGTKFLIAPVFLDIHDISKEHKHIGMVYFIKASTDKITRAVLEHNDIRWFSGSELVQKQFDISAAIKYYAKEAIKKTTR